VSKARLGGKLLTTFSDAFELTEATRMVNALEARLSAAGKQAFQAAWVGWTRSGGKGLERVYGRRAGIPRRHRRVRRVWAGRVVADSLFRRVRTNRGNTHSKRVRNAFMGGGQAFPGGISGLGGNSRC
jgi:hypothetical protein